MATYVLLTKIAPEHMPAPQNLKKIEEQIKERIEKSGLKVTWVSNYAVLGPYDYLDIFEAPDNLTASKLATIIRSFGHATTETWGAIGWDQFKNSIQDI